MEIINLVILGLGLLEGLFLCIEMHRRNELLRANNLLIDTIQKAKELEDNSRRKVEGTFGNPLQDGYRKNKSGLYTPIKPNKNPYDIRPHIGDDEDDV